jgi:protein involved in polysaccharide export with SLBB domain
VEIWYDRELLDEELLLMIKSLLTLVIISVTLLVTVQLSFADISVEVKGAFKRPGTYTFPDDSMLSDAVRKSRGITDNNLSSGYIIRKDTRDLNFRLSKLKDEIEGTLYDYVHKTTKSFDFKNNLTPQQSAILSTVESINANLRVPVVIKHFRLLKGSEDDVTLQNGDVIVLPQIKDTVSVYGCVKNPGEYPFSKIKSVGHFISKAGGASKCADTEYIYTIAPNGSVKKIDNTMISWSEENKRWEMKAFTEDSSVFAGDIVIVPFDTDDYPWLKNSKDLNERLINILAVSDIDKYKSFTEILSK